MQESLVLVGRVSICHTEIGKIGDNISFLFKKLSYAFLVLATDTILLIVLVQQHILFLFYWPMYNIFQAIPFPPIG